MPGPQIFPWFRTAMLAVAAAACLGSPALGAAPQDEPLQFNRDIRPILSDHCFACHGFDPKHRKGNLRLDVADSAYGAGKSGEVAIKPGVPSASALWKRITTSDADDVMPPPDTHKELSAAQKETLRRWIEQGAPYQKHWAFEPPLKVEPPVLPGAALPSNPVDRFLRARLVHEGLSPSPEASRDILVRRVSFDLTGLPPTSDEVRTYLDDSTPGAYERMVERFLHSPRYGEQMARHWLDVARYADTHGLHLDNERSMWPYRDWVVKAFNRNLPFDRFTIEQLAGDLLPNPTQEQLIATGFNRNNVSTSEGGSIDAEFVFRYAVDRTATAVQTWMGLTAGCAVCHDHKFDPISAKEFYSLYAFFHSAADPAMDGNISLTPPILKLRTPEDDARLKEFDARLAASEARLQEAYRGVDYTDPATLATPPPPQDVETTWADDEIPAGWRITASPGAEPMFVTDGPVKPFSGKRALRRQDAGLAQDVIEAGPAPLILPQSARLVAHVYLDPANPPRAIMLQYRTDEWRHRAVWGDYDVIDWGRRDTTERVNQGALPRSGAWVRLEVEASALGLKSDDKVTGFALTQHGGTVYWDQVGVKGRVDPTTDPRRSYLAWVRQHDGKDVSALPEKVRKIFKDTTAGKRSEGQEAQLREHFLVRECADTRAVFDPLLGTVAAMKKQRDEYEGAIPATLVWKDMDERRESFVMERGAYDRPGDRVIAGVPAALPALVASGTNGPTRLDFAQWLTDPKHPLTARVTVNRFWQQFFGVGLVKTSGDFGSQGEPPRHPDLLDWLAVTFQESGWDVRGLVRLMLTSEAYRQSSRVSPEVLQKDPENRLLARGPRFRLDAEQLRDNALYLGGLMVDAMGGKGVKPYQPPNIWEPVGFVGSNTREYRQDSGSALYRRSLYTFFKRTAPPPFMVTFDSPNREQSCNRRERSNTPLQALQLMNDVQYFEAARGLAERVMIEGGASARDRLRFAFRTVLARQPDAAELEEVQRAFNQHLARYQASPADAQRVVAAGDSTPRAHLPGPELAAYTLVANLLLNLDETVTRN